MKFGKLFKKFNEKYGTSQWSDNKVSGLTYKELQLMAKTMKNDGNPKISKYCFISKSDLAKEVYAGLKNIVR